MKKNLNGFNPNTPTNGIVIKNIPEEIRKKANEIINVLKEIEKDRLTDSFSNIDELIKFAFLVNNGLVGSGLYMKPKDMWIGCTNINSFPQDVKLENDMRITFDNQSYVFKELEGEKILSLSNNFLPSIYYDLFTFDPKENKFNFNNIGTNNPNNFLFANFISKAKDCIFPYLQVHKNSKCRTTVPLDIKNTFSFSCLFNNIFREYVENHQTINPDDISILMFIKDKFENVKIGLGYDKSYHLFFIKNKEKFDTKFILSEKAFYQICIKYLNGHVIVCVDDTEIYKTELPLITNKQLLFSVGEDLDFGNYANGSFVFGEINIFDIAITNEENLVLKNNPRNWNFKTNHGYSNFSIEEKLKIKGFISNK